MGFKNSEEAKLLKKEEPIDYGSVVEVSDKKSKKKERQQEETSNIFHLFKYTTKADKVLLITGIVFSLISGACFPILGLFFGGMTNIFINQAVQGLIPDEVVNATIANVSAYAKPVAITYDQHFIPLSAANNTIVYETAHVLKEIFEAEIPQKHLWGNESTLTPMTAYEFRQTLDRYLIIYILIGTVMMLCSFIQTVCWEYVSEHQVHNIRKIYFSQIIRQDISWYDTNDNGNLPNKLTDDLEKIRDGTGYKCAMIVQYLSTFFAGIAVGLYVNFSLTLVTLCVGPFLIGLTAYSAKFAALSAAREQEKYGFAGAVAEETLSNIKTVQAFCGHSVSVKRYEVALEAGRKIAMSRYNLFSVFIAITFSLLYLAYALGFWYGSKLVQDGVSTPGSVFTVFLSVIVGAFSIGNALPFFNSVSCAVGVMTSIRQIISRKVTIDPYSESGRKLKQVVGSIEFRNVSFNYPSRPNVSVLNDLNLKIEPGSTAAIVGSSGAGKSTIVGLILRFYDPTQGSITIDNIPVNEFNTNWLRRQIGIVSQEPVLFGVSIAENIRYGREDVTNWEIIDAAKGANAHDFITKLPKGYDTMVGDTGSQLSGGQKQRIAIARALVRNPKILLLDEATSALDAHSEGIVQEALEKAMSGRTTIIVAHRLSTVRNADTIYVMQNGALCENGKHEELMEKRSLYYNLVVAQTLSRNSDAIESSVDETDDDSLSVIDEAEESPVETEITVTDEKQRYNRQLSPKQIWKKIKNDEEKYDVRFSTPLEEVDELQQLNRHENEDKEHWKVLDRNVATETISDDNDEEYETVVTHVRETREILYSDEDENTETVTEIPRDIENPAKESTARKRKRQSNTRINTPDKEIKTEPLKKSEIIEQNITMWELVKYHKPDYPWLLLGLIGSVCVGLIMPIYSLYYGNMFAVFTKKGDELKKETHFWTCMYILLVVYSAFAYYTQATGMTTLNEKLIVRIRLLVFKNILRQPVGWFDFDTSSPGILVNRLARNAPLIKAAAGSRAGLFLSSTVTLIGAFIVALIYGPELAIILIICVPILIYTFYKQRSILSRNMSRDFKCMDEAGRFASETVRNIRTVQALGQEKLFAAMYSENLKTPYQEAIKKAFLYSALYAATQSIMYYMYALGFRVGGYFVEIGEMRADNVYKVFFALSLCAINVGHTFSYFQDLHKARTSARLLNYLLNRRPEIDATSHLGIKPDIKGKIQFKKVHFSYPVRPDVKVLRGVNLIAEAGKTLALVGESGCGKSTIISLLERFYDPVSGSIKIDGCDICAINLAHLRSKIGLVTQEPILFDSSIRDNIAYGAATLKEVSFDDILNAAKLANVHDFVMNLPERYDTIVGERGIQLSGGQKQRVAIARALIRDPKILLLDEATSALDTENEKIVQEALDRVKKGRTCIIVAHRLSTIQNADKICVMQKGRIIETGTHEELLVMKGRYYQLTQRQVI